MNSSLIVTTTALLTVTLAGCETECPKCPPVPTSAQATQRGVAKTALPARPTKVVSAAPVATVGGGGNGDDGPIVQHWTAPMFGAKGKPMGTAFGAGGQVVFVPELKGGFSEFAMEGLGGLAPTMSMSTATTTAMTTSLDCRFVIVDDAEQIIGAVTPLEIATIPTVVLATSGLIESIQEWAAGGGLGGPEGEPMFEIKPISRPPEDVAPPETPLSAGQYAWSGGKCSDPDIDCLSAEPPGEVLMMCSDEEGEEAKASGTLPEDCVEQCGDSGCGETVCQANCGSCDTFCDATGLAA
ncbi:MAG: hypothetical protein K0V04_31305, partial [Deltaproteobacteria bacterium]|nr:hypothetical protein [Deltaproteobacteria bacterium]